MNEVVCNKCGQTGMLVNPGVPCLRRYANGTKVCDGVMELGFPIQEGVLEKIKASERQAANRKRRKLLKICRQCSSPLAQNSVSFCEKHLKEHRAKARLIYVSKND